MALTLESCLEVEPDVILRFEDGEDVPAHALILRFWSGVLGETLRATKPPAEGSSGPMVIPMTGTLRSDWLKVAAFMYPSDIGIVSWDNLKALMVLADKYDMPAIALKAATFLDEHCNELTDIQITDYKLQNDIIVSEYYIWKWLPLLEKAVLCCKSKRLLERCLFTAAGPFRETCTAEHLASLSHESLVLFGTAMAGTLEFSAHEKAVSARLMCPRCEACDFPEYFTYLRVHRCRICSEVFPKKQ
jgi:hypothetical protein